MARRNISPNLRTRMYIPFFDQVIRKKEVFSSHVFPTLFCNPKFTLFPRRESLDFEMGPKGLDQGEKPKQGKTMKKTIALACLPMLAACNDGGSIGGSVSVSSSSYTVADRVTSISVSSDPANNDVLAVRNAGTINGTPDAGSAADAQLNNGNIAPVTDASTNTNAFEKQNTYDGNTSTAMNGWTVKQSQFDDIGNAGHVAGFVEMNRLYNPSGDLIAIETTGTAASNVPVASLRYYGEWNGHIAGTDYENGYAYVVVNTGTNQADLYVADPTSAQAFINEVAGPNTLSYSAINNTVTGAVLFDTGTQTADGQAIMRLYGDHNNTQLNEGYVAGQAYTDSGQPFDALIGFIAIQD